MKNLEPLGQLTLMDDLENRVAKTEWQIERQDQNIRELYDTTEEMQKCLRSIHEVLIQIKWFVLGGACLYFADHLGLGYIFKIFGV